jgi:hypothetical protein
MFSILVPITTWAVFRKVDGLVQIVSVVGVFSLIAVTASLFASTVEQSSDIEILNGSVTSKASRHVSCSHSYDCHCKSVVRCSGSGKHRSCSTNRVCDTCYEHNFDVSWGVQSTINSFDISRVNRQGTEEPPRFTLVKVGDPVSETHRYTNWVKAVPESLFNNQLAIASSKNKFISLVPAYPDNVYDYQYVDRVIPIGVPLTELPLWNKELATAISVLGPSKQVNAVILMVKTNDPNYEYVIRNEWLGGKKNDVIVIFGITEYPKIDWVRIMSWTDNQLFKVELRDALQDIGSVADRKIVLQTISDNIKKSFQRKHMRDFEYLANEIMPPTWLIVFLVVLILVANIGAVVLAKRNNPYTKRRIK